MHFYLCTQRCQFALIMRRVTGSPQKNKWWLCIAVVFHGRKLLPCEYLCFVLACFERNVGVLVKLASENIRFSSLFAAGDVSRGGTSSTKRQKFHTDDANQCLQNKSGSHGVPKRNLSNFTCLLVDFGKVLCSSANEVQQNSNASPREDYVPQTFTVLLEILRVCVWPLWPFVFCLSFVNNS